MIDLRLSEDQQQMVDGMVRVLANSSPVSRLRPSGSGADVHADLAELGWFRLGLPEERGGLGLGIAEEALLFIEAGRFVLSPTILATTLAAHACADEVLPGLLRGQDRAALAIIGESGAVVLDHREAALLLVVGGDNIWLAPAQAFGGDAVAGFDESLPTAAGQIDPAARIAVAACWRLRVLAAAMLAGIARASADLAVDYARVREQFGQPIGAFQAIKHICADMGLRAYAAEAQVKMAAVTAADTPDRAAREVAAAALTALVAARENAESAIQVHGGIGFTAECDAHFFLKRAHVLGYALGGLESCRRAVLAEPAAGEP